MPEIHIYHWVTFCVAVGTLLLLDLTVFHKKSHTPSLRESAAWTVFWCSLALGFNGVVWYFTNTDLAIQFLSGYLLEWSLSMDNVFVFIVVFSYFRVPLKYQYRVLFWGILGAIAMRLTFILVAGSLLERFDWMISVFGAFLLYTGIKLAFHHGGESDPERNPLTRIARKLLPVAKGEHGDKFFVRLDGKLFVTQLFLVLIIVEGTDVVFAIDSVPAIYGVVTTENQSWQQFLVFTSNVFAIMGLRALYFLLAGMVGAFRYLSVGLAAVLIFVGLKMILVGHHLPLIGEVIPKEWLPNWASLLIIISLLAISIIASLLANARDRRYGLAGDDAEAESTVYPDGPGPEESNTNNPNADSKKTGDSSTDSSSTKPDESTRP